MHALLHTVSPTLQQATADPCFCQRFLNTLAKSGSVSCGITGPFSWVLVHTRFCLCPQRVCFQSCVSSGSSMVGLMVTFSKRAYGDLAYPVLLHPEPLQQSTLDLYLCRRHSNTVLSQSLWDLWVLVHTRFV